MKRLLKGVLGALLAAVASVGALFAVASWRDGDFERENPAPGKLAGSPGALVHVVERLGNGTVAVLIHGNPGTALDFGPVQEKLRTRSLAPDRPGYGWSDRPSALMGPGEQARALHAVVRELGVERAVVVGFDWGGAVAASWAAQFPEETRALVLVAAVADPDLHYAMPARQERLTQGLEGRALAWSLGPLLAPPAISDALTTAFAPLPPLPEVVERARLHFARPRALLASAWDWKALESAQRDVAARMGNLQLPVEVLVGSEDKVLGPAHAEFLAAHLKGAHVVKVPGAGHQLLATHPAEVAAAVERALARSGKRPE